MNSGIKILYSLGSEDLARVLDLRYRVLRAPHGMPPESAGFPHDDRASTLHVLATRDALLVGCVSLMFDADAPNGQATQLRGMAVDASCQRAGVGRMILNEVYRIGRERHCGYWCNARHSAIGFYLRHGWVTDGPMFDIPVVGPHVVMRWNLGV